MWAALIFYGFHVGKYSPFVSIDPMGILVLNDFDSNQKGAGLLGRVQQHITLRQRDSHLWAFPQVDEGTEPLNLHQLKGLSVKKMMFLGTLRGINEIYVYVDIMITMYS